MNDEEIEKAILFYIIFQKEQFDITEKDFVNPIHKKIIQAVNRLIQKKQEITMLTVKNEMNDSSKDILAYLSILGEFISNSNSETIYKILKNYTKRREVFNMAQRMQVEIKEAENPDLFIEKSISNLQKIEFQTKQDEDFVSQLIKTIELIESNMTKEKNYDLHTGIFDLDALTDGLHEGELTVIGARPRSRKNNFRFANSR
jgi:replicative DNA helicase